MAETHRFDEMGWRNCAPMRPCGSGKPMSARGPVNDGVGAPVWWVTRDGDLDCLEMYERHYSVNTKRAAWRERKLFIGPGAKFVLRTEAGDAFFAWREFIDDCIDERTGQGQEGINCAAFRNESPHLSSELIRQADAIADVLWPHRRHYTYVNREKVASTNPGYCFLQAGWKRCGVTKGGLLILERVNG